MLEVRYSLFWNLDVQEWQGSWFKLWLVLVLSQLYDEGDPIYILDTNASTRPGLL